MRQFQCPLTREQNLDVLEIDSGLVEPGEMQTFRFIAPEPGEYTVICTVSGHYPLMQGRLVAQ